MLESPESLHSKVQLCVIIHRLTYILTINIPVICSFRKESFLIYLQKFRNNLFISCESSLISFITVQNNIFDLTEFFHVFGQVEEAIAVLQAHQVKECPAKEWKAFLRSEMLHYWSQVSSWTPFLNSAHCQIAFFQCFLSRSEFVHCANFPTLDIATKWTMNTFFLFSGQLYSEEVGEDEKKWENRNVWE